MARKPLFTRLPEIWKNLDYPRDGRGRPTGDPGVLERFLSVLDSSLDLTGSKVAALLDLRSIDRIPDRYLHLIGELVGHRWRSDKDKAWNRRKIATAIHRYSYKGTMANLNDLVREHGGGASTVVDNASKLLVLGKQGRLSYDDAYLVSPDYYHDGAFDMTLSEDVDFAAFMVDFLDRVAAGEKWYFRLSGQQDGIFEADWDENSFSLQPQFTPDGSIGFGIIGVNLFISTQPNGVAKTSTSPIYWDLEGNILDGSIGYGQLGFTLFLSTEPSSMAEEEVYSIEEGVGGASLTLDSITQLDSTAFDISIGEGNPLAPGAVPIQNDGDIE